MILPDLLLCKETEMLKNGKVLVQRELVEYGFVTPKEIKRIKKMIKPLCKPYYKGSRTHGTADVYDLAEVIATAEDILATGGKLTAGDALSIAKRLIQEIQFVEVDYE